MNTQGPRIPGRVEQHPTRQELEQKVFRLQDHLRKLNTVVDELEEANSQLTAEIVELRKERNDTD